MMTATQQPCWKTKWPLKRVKYLATCNDEVLPETTDAHFELDYLDIGNVTSTGVVTGTELLQFKAAPSRARRRVRHGDIIVSTVRTYLRAIARIDHPNPNLVVSTGFAVIRPGKEIDARFLGYALRSNEFVDEVVARSTGVSYPAISSTELIKIPAPLPPPSEQRRIADFLDRETDQIDRLIAEKEKLVGLLEEKRKAVISHAVTQGLNPNAKMRDSRVPWLGMIPTHWQVKRLRFLGSIKSGCGFPQNKQGCPDGELPFFKVKHLGCNGAGLTIGSPSDFISIETAHELGAYVFPQESVVFAKIGAALMLNRFRLLERASCIDNNMMGFMPDPRDIVAEYAAHMLSHFQMRSLANPGAVPSLNVQALRDTFFPVPDSSEQQAILKYVGRKTASINAAELECSKIIGFLRERRAALISAAVTGRLDVRGAAE